MQDQTHGRGRADPDRKLSLRDAPQSQTEKDLPKDLVFEILYNRRRRDVITYLQENGGTATISDLAEYIAARENETTVDALSSSERKCVYVGLYQNHLPMMDDAGVVSYNKDRGTVELRASVAQLEPYLDDDDEAEATSYRLTAGGALCLAGLFLLGALDIGVFSPVPNPLWVTFGVVWMLVLVFTDVYGLSPLADG